MHAACLHPFPPLNTPATRSLFMSITHQHLRFPGDHSAKYWPSPIQFDSPDRSDEKGSVLHGMADAYCSKGTTWACDRDMASWSTAELQNLLAITQPSCVCNVSCRETERPASFELAGSLAVWLVLRQCCCCWEHQSC